MVAGGADGRAEGDCSTGRERYDGTEGVDMKVQLTNGLLVGKMRISVVDNPDLISNPESQQEFQRGSPLNQKSV